MIRSLRSLVTVLSVCLLATAAAAQDYTVTHVTSGTSYRYVQPPTTGVTTLQDTQNPALGVTGTAPIDYSYEVKLPFSFPYFGATYSSIWVCTHGYAQFGTTQGSSQWVNTTFPPSGSDDGMLAPLWDNLDPSIATGSGRIVHWTSGTAPNRTWTVSWEGVPQYTNSGPAGSTTFQIQLYETSGLIAFAYKADSAPSTWVQLSWSQGIDAPNGSTSLNDTRYIAPRSTSNTNAGHPASDELFTPRTVTYTGTLLYDRVVSDKNGIGPGLQTAQPLANFALEVRRKDGSAAFTTATDGAGAFSVKTFAMDAAAAGNGSLAVIAANAACNVRTGLAAAPTSYAFRSNFSFAGTSGSTSALGTTTVNAAADASGNARIPFFLAKSMQTTRDWVVARTSKTIGTIDVLYDPASSALTSYAPPNVVAGTPAYVRVGSTGSTNPDGWDTFPVRREYARYVLAAIAASPSTSVDTRFDAITDDENAFAEAFGCYLHAIISRETEFGDGLTSSTGSALAIESPTLTSRKGTDVAGWVAAMLYDLTDASNEAWDKIDGTSSTGERPFSVTATLASPVTASAFYKAWGTAGYDGLALSRSYVAHGLLADDALEANDYVSEPASLGAVGSRRGGLILNVYNEDWYVVQLPAAAPHLVADVTFDRAAYDTTPLLEIRSLADAVLATGSFVVQGGPMHASTGPLAAGTYRLRVAHAGGVRLGDYSVQTFVPIVFSTDAFPEWTAGRPLSVQQHASGGIPPYTLSVGGQYVLPAGLVLDSKNLRVGGAAADAGSHYFVLQISDDGRPASTASVPVPMKINEALGLHFGSFTGFPLGRATNRPVPRTGGTDPVLMSVSSGALPDGLTLDPQSLSFTGTATTPGPVDAGFDAYDLAGSQASGSTRAVVCAAFESKAVGADLGTGASACGWYFDAVANSTVSIGLATSKGRAKRPIEVTIVGPDGASVTGGKVRISIGGAKLTSVPCPLTGRYYCIVSSVAGDEATQLTGTAKVVPPAKGLAKLDAFAVPATQEIAFGALAGSKLTFKATPDKASGLKIGLLSLLDPTGRVVDIATEARLSPSGNGFSLAADLNASGTWRLVISAVSGSPGRVSVSWKIKEPKITAFDAGTQ